MHITQLSNFWNRHERWLGVLFFAGGIVWDALTLRRIDNWVDNTILLSYFMALVGVIALHGRVLGGRRVPPWLIRVRHWVRPAIQFLLGALLSALVIFYARTISWTTGSVYWAVLVVGLVGNEILLRRRVSFPALVGTLFLVGATIAAYLVPVVAGRMGLDLYRLALALAVIPAGLLVAYGARHRAFKSRMRLLATLVGVAVLAVLLDTAYRHNWIPPVPLAVEAGGIYENVRRDGDDFVATWQSRDWGLFARDYAHELYVAEGDTVFAFSAVFAPTGLREKIYHVWQHGRGEEWVATDRIGYSVLGGRDGGYRGITFKRQLAEGRWRVLVETSDGRILTRIPFEMVRGAAPSEHPEPTASLRERRF